MDHSAVRAFGDGFLRPQGRVYLDAAATSLMPRAVLAAQRAYYESSCANPHTNAHGPGRSSTALVEAARQQVARLFGLNLSQWAVVFCGSGSTAALNRAAHAIYPQMRRQRGRTQVVSTVAEHHSNFLPWQRLAGASNVWSTPVRVDGSLDLDALAAMLSRNHAQTATIAATWASNVTGAVSDVERLASLARAAGVPLVLDAAQAAPHMPLEIPPGVAAVAISGHKLYAPGSPGILLIRREWLDLSDSPIGEWGGGTVESVSDLGVVFSSRAEAREEAGTPNVAGILGIGLVCGVLERVGLENIRAHEWEQTQKLLALLRSVPGLTLYGAPKPGGVPRLGVASFNLAVPHAAVAAALDAAGVCVRNECFCAQPCVRALLSQTDSAASTAAQIAYGRKVPTRPGMVRASLGPWTRDDDLRLLADSLRWAAAHPNAVCDACAPCGDGSYLYIAATCETTRPCFSLPEQIERAATNW